LVAGFDGAGAGHEDQLLAARNYTIRKSNGGAFRAEVAAREFVWGGDAIGIVDAGENFEFGDLEVVRRADAGENGLSCSGGAVDVETEFNHALDYLLDVFFGGLALHCDDHGISFALLFVT